MLIDPGSLNPIEPVTPRERNTAMPFATHYCPVCDAFYGTPCTLTWGNHVTPLERAQEREMDDAVAVLVDYADDAETLTSVYRALADPDSGWTIYRPAIRL